MPIYFSNVFGSLEHENHYKIFYGSIFEILIFFDLNGGSLIYLNTSHILWFSCSGDSNKLDKNIGTYIPKIV